MELPWCSARAVETWPMLGALGVRFAPMDGRTIKALSNKCGGFCDSSSLSVVFRGWNVEAGMVSGSGRLPGSDTCVCAFLRLCVRACVQGKEKQQLSFLHVYHHAR